MLCVSSGKAGLYDHERRTPPPLGASYLVDIAYVCGRPQGTMRTLRASLMTKLLFRAFSLRASAKRVTVTSIYELPQLITTECSPTRRVISRVQRGLCLSLSAVPSIQNPLLLLSHYAS